MKIYFLRGVSGSGKSTEAMRLANNNKDVICSADDYFMKDGEYIFNPSLLAAAHGETGAYNGWEGDTEEAMLARTEAKGREVATLLKVSK